MPKLAKPATDTSCQALKAGKTLAAGNGLHLEASMSGRKSWFVRYRKHDDGKRAKVLIGYYPDVTLAEAGVMADEIHLAARTGGQIIGVRTAVRMRRETKTANELRIEREKAQAEANSFTTISEAWLKYKAQSWSADTARRAEDAVRQYLQPAIGQLDMRSVRSKDVSSALLEINAKVPSTARKCRQYIYGIVDYCIMRGIRDDDSLLSLKGIFPRNKEERNHPAITKAAGIGQLWLAISNHSGSHTVRSALQFVAWTTLRPGVIVTATWDEIDTEAALWCIPGERMKMRSDHVVSLPKQALAMLETLRAYQESEYVFPAVARQGRPHIHRDSLSKALREDLGYRDRHVTHGWRASFRTLARERLGVDIDVLEKQLAHASGDRTAQAYDRAQFIEQRRIVMQTWADWLDEQAAIAAGGNVTPIREAV